MAKCLLRLSYLILLKNLFHQITSLATWDRANSSTLVLDIVIVFYFVKYQLIGPLNSLNRYPSILYLVARLSTNAALLVYIIWLPKIAEYLIAKLHVL